MKYHKQTIYHDPDNGKWGDCYRTCIACILDLDIKDVPHFTDKGRSVDEANRLRDVWLFERRLCSFSVAYELPLKEILQMQAVHNPHAFYILTGEGTTGVNHCVVGRGGAIIHNPHSACEITGPSIMDDPGWNRKLYWLGVLAKI